MTKTLEQNLQQLRQMREMLSPFSVSSEKCEENLDTLKTMREMISPACTVTEEERKSNLEEISYVSNIRRTR